MCTPIHVCLCIYPDMYMFFAVNVYCMPASQRHPYQCNMSSRVAAAAHIFYLHTYTGANTNIFVCIDVRKCICIHTDVHMY